MIDIEEFRSYLLINKNSLDDEVSRQPSLFEKVGDAYTEAAAERDALKEALATVDARLDIAVRKASEKITEAAVKSQIQLHKDHLGAFKAYLAAKEQTDKLGVLKDSFHMRSQMLKELSGLYISNYFEASSSRGNARTDKAVYERQRARLAEGRKE